LQALKNTEEEVPLTASYELTHCPMLEIMVCFPLSYSLNLFSASLFFTPLSLLKNDMPANALNRLSLKIFKK
jgi:hypothetical protein